MDYLGRNPEAYKGVSDDDMSRMYLSRGNFYLWFADKMYKSDELYYYGEFKFLQESKVGEFCNAYTELIASPSTQAAGVLNRIVGYGIDAYDQYDYYCTSSATSCQITNEQVTKLKRIDDEIKY